ncbi:MAG TPA: SRPBCC domain-containing protein [Gemmatimonadaceae bacterium]|nr:SRPBCC domain-containing protein [Gemmatimonadaceae bacterium]
MANHEVQHATFVFERTSTAPVGRVFAALANPVERAEWGVPSEKAALVYERADFREGGQDVFRCGPKHDPQYRGVTTYLDIVPNERIVTTELVETNERKLLATLSTTLLESREGGTHITVTVQLASLAGEDMIQGAKCGTGASLDNLVKALG